MTRGNTDSSHQSGQEVRAVERHLLTNRARKDKLDVSLWKTCSDMDSSQVNSDDAPERTLLS